MTFAGLHDLSYILSMEALAAFPFSRDMLTVARVLVAEALLAGTLWALHQVVLKFLAWLYSIRQTRIDLNNLRAQVMELRAELVRCTTPAAVEEKRREIIPPPLVSQTYVISEADLKEDAGWEDDDDKTSSRT